MTTKITQTLNHTYDLEGKLVVLHDKFGGRGYHVGSFTSSDKNSPNKNVSGYEMVRRIEYAEQQIKNLLQARDNMLKLMEEAYVPMDLQEILDMPNDEEDEESLTDDAAHFVEPDEPSVDTLLDSEDYGMFSEAGNRRVAELVSSVARYLLSVGHQANRVHISEAQERLENGMQRIADNGEGEVFDTAVREAIVARIRAKTNVTVSI